MKSPSPPTEFIRLVEIMATLREPGGCPWDAEQTPDSLTPYLLEETYELLEALDGGDPDLICEELGDLLLQVVFLARIYEERGDFSIAEVASGIADKLIRRHPHVFSGQEAGNRQDLHRSWQRIKEGEKKGRGESTTFLGSLPRNLPALQRAHKVTEKASRVGFDWPKAEAVLDKVREETSELEEALLAGDGDGMEREMGDLLFTLVNLGRLAGIDAESALRRTVDRFVNRFDHVEESLRAQGVELETASLQEMDLLWEEAKGKEPKRSPSPFRE